ncbi:hypothetical protein [Spirosoma aerolatum]|uniref:hypothetical protein n=1 Tax=Spirosoma aerolatum TaxID=1211326 RepID=UPI0012D2D059|nr:hypothetical protein [Spirosoma aerolatum]
MFKSLFFSAIGLLLSTAVHTQATTPMFKMDYEISIGKARLKGLESVTVESSVDLISDTCQITLPGMVYNKAFAIEDSIKRGDVVTVRLGYDGNLHTEFTGYLKSIHPNAPMLLECEDSAYLLRKQIADKQFKKVTVPDILKYVLTQINPQLTADQQLKLVTDLSGYQYDKFTIVRSNGYEVLERIKSDFGPAIYCRGHELHCHLTYTEKRGNVTYDFARNVEESDGLEYVKAEDVKVKIKAIGRSKKGTKVEVEVGDPKGDLRTIQLPTVSDKVVLEKRAKELLKTLSYDGYKGAIKGWLIPVCEIGYSAKVVDVDYPDRAGTYYVNGVKTEFSENGGRRTVSLGIKVLTKTA